VSGNNVNRQAIDEYLQRVNLPRAIAGIRDEARKIAGLRGPYLRGLSISLETMWDLAMEVLGKGNPVPYPRCVEGRRDGLRKPSKPEAKRERVAELLGRAGYSIAGSGELVGAVDAWRQDRLVPMASVRALGAAVIAQLDRLTEAHLSPYLPEELRPVPRRTRILRTIFRIPAVLTHNEFMA
jgi:hypothetical protein